TALELEFGFPQVARWLASRAGKARIHYGVSVSHIGARALAQPGLAQQVEAELEAVTGDIDFTSLLGKSGAAIWESHRRALQEGDLPALWEALERGLREGALGIGMPLQYYPGADRSEIFRVFQFASEKEAPVFVHVRSIGMEAIQEVTANAAATGAALHIVHVNSSSLWQLPAVLDLIGGARQRGANVTVEAYPYTAGSTSIESSIFDSGWQQLLGINYGDLQWQKTRERLTAESFARYREQGGTVIIHSMKEEMIELAFRTPFVMVASDGMPYNPGAHPRSAGTFSRILGRYVRERGVLSLAEALRRMTIMPVQRLEIIAPQMKKKGRLQVGADADIVIFDAERVIDTATFESDLSFSEGIRHVLV
ncbi:MAG TPA: amidohydrolase family protein, partial [Sphingomonadales bacterium]|nr:amidohydrolase family protein [Sphingomonadales bacterium]